jgi:hypothetical protein
MIYPKQQKLKQIIMHTPTELHFWVTGERKSKRKKIPTPSHPNLVSHTALESVTPS